MDREQALFVVNTIHEQMASLSRGIVNAMSDGKIGTWEAWVLGLRGMTTVSSLIAVLQQMDKKTLADILYVLEHGVWTLPQEKL